MPTPKVVYGGPYATEADAITEESQKENPNYDELTKDWKTISSGAVAYIEQLHQPIVPPVGEFVVNVVETEEEEVPETVLYTTPDEAPAEETPAEEKADSDKDLEEFGL